MSARLLTALVAVIIAAPTFSAEQFPSRPVRFIVPYAPGGGADVMSRPVFQKLSEALGQQLLADNRGSAGGIIAVELAAKAALMPAIKPCAAASS